MHRFIFWWSIETFYIWRFNYSMVKQGARIKKQQMAAPRSWSSFCMSLWELNAVQPSLYDSHLFFCFNIFLTHSFLWKFQPSCLYILHVKTMNCRIKAYLWENREGKVKSERKRNAFLYMFNIWGHPACFVYLFILSSSTCGNGFKLLTSWLKVYVLTSWAMLRLTYAYPTWLKVVVLVFLFVFLWEREREMMLGWFWNVEVYLQRGKREGIKSKNTWISFLLWQWWTGKSCICKWEVWFVQSNWMSYRNDIVFVCDPLQIPLHSYLF